MCISALPEARRCFLIDHEICLFDHRLSIMRADKENNRPVATVKTPELIGSMF